MLVGVLTTCAACTDDTSELTRLCGGDLQVAPLGIRTAPAEQGRGLWVIDPRTDEPTADQLVTVRADAGGFDVVTDDDGWASWPDLIAADETLDLTTAWESEVQTSWLGVQAGCVALASKARQPFGTLSVPGGSLEEIQVALRIDVSHLPPDRSYVLSFQTRASNPSHRQQAIAAGASEVTIDVETFRGRAIGFQVFALAAGEIVAARDWSNVVGWIGGQLYASGDSNDGDEVGQWVIAPVAQDVLTMRLRPGDLGMTNGTEAAYSRFSYEGHQFSGPQVGLTPGQTEVKVPLPDLGVALLTDITFELSSATDVQFRWAASERVSERSFVPFPLMNARMPQSGADVIDLGPRDEHGNLTLINAFRTDVSTGGVSRAIMFVFDDRRTIELSPMLQQIVDSQAPSFHVQDIHLADAPDPQNLGGPLSRQLGYVSQLVPLTE